MKTIKKLMMLLVAVFSLMTFSACDSDTTTRWELEGVWTGDFAMQLYLGGHYSKEAYKTTLYLYDNREGKQVDFYRIGNTSTIDTNYFTWDVRGGRIIMNYDDGTMRGQTVTISSYTLYNGYWEGIVEGHNFRMTLEQYQMHCNLYREHIESIRKEFGAFSQIIGNRFGYSLNIRLDSFCLSSNE